MSSKSEPYRWNTSPAAEAFDRAAEFIHPFYLAIQDEILRHLPFGANDEFLFVDLGAGSGRLVERMLENFPYARAVLIDQSEPFLAIAERRLRPFGDRATLIRHRLQDDWPSALSAQPSAFLSMSAIHHLDAAEKRSLFARCRAALAPSGIFINGDEVRPENDAEFREHLEWWAEHMEAAQQRGEIPSSFRATLDAWYDRNIRRFGQPTQSGDDCLETIAAQAACLRDAGFQQVDAVWTAKVWSVVVAKSGAPIR